MVLYAVLDVIYFDMESVNDKMCFVSAHVLYVYVLFCWTVPSSLALGQPVK